MARTAVTAPHLIQAIQQDHNRNRRYTGPALIARKLLLLDLVLSEPEHDWYATEADKVDLFVNRLGVPVQALPQRTYESKTSANATNTTHSPSPVTTRYCVQKLPVFLDGDPARVHFVCVVTEPKAREVEAFIADHARLLMHLDAWTLVAAGPQAVVHEEAYAAAFARGLGAITKTPRLGDLKHDRIRATQGLVKNGRSRSAPTAGLSRNQLYSIDPGCLRPTDAWARPS